MYQCSLKYLKQVRKNEPYSMIEGGFRKAKRVLTKDEKQNLKDNIQAFIRIVQKYKRESWFQHCDKLGNLQLKDMNCNLETNQTLSERQAKTLTALLLNDIFYYFTKVYLCLKHDLRELIQKNQPLINIDMDLKEIHDILIPTIILIRDIDKHNPQVSDDRLKENAIALSSFMTSQVMRSLYLD
jgi:hypothetical protein